MTRNEFLTTNYQTIKSIAGKVWGRHKRRFPIPLQYEDYEQQVFLKLLACKKDYDPCRSRLTTYLGIVAYSVLIDYLRRDNKFYHPTTPTCQYHVSLQSDEVLDENESPSIEQYVSPYEKTPAHLHKQLTYLLDDNPPSSIDPNDLDDILDYLMNE